MTGAIGGYLPFLRMSRTFGKHLNFARALKSCSEIKCTPTGRQVSGKSGCFFCQPSLGEKDSVSFAWSREFCDGRREADCAQVL